MIDKEKNNIKNSSLEETSSVLSGIINSNEFNINISHDVIELNLLKPCIFNVAKLFKDHEKLKFNQLIDLTAVDYPGNKKRFEMVYIFLSVYYNKRLIIKFFIDEEDNVESLTNLFPASNWYEREVWDLFGITFNNHPDLRRLLTDYGFIGHPLRKDFPLSGNVEVKYDINSKKVIYEPIKLTQSFRDFDFESPWEGEILNKNNE